MLIKKSVPVILRIISSSFKIRFLLYPSAIEIVFKRFNKFKIEKCLTFKQNPKPMFETSGTTSRN